jgi:hypothetical protein
MQRLLVCLGDAANLWITRHSETAKQRYEFKGRLPQWVKNVELYEFVGCLLALFYVAIFGLFRVYSLIHGRTAHPSSVASGLLTMPTIFINVPLSFVLANVISRQIPSVRRANEIAMEGLEHVSYKRYQKDLLTVVSWIAPLYLIAIVLGLVDPFWLS